MPEGWRPMAWLLLPARREERHVRAFERRPGLAAIDQDSQARIRRGQVDRAQRLAQKREHAAHRDVRLAERAADEPLLRAALPAVTLELGEPAMHLCAAAFEPRPMALIGRPERVLVDLLATFFGGADRHRHLPQCLTAVASSGRQQRARRADAIIQIIQYHRRL